MVPEKVSQVFEMLLEQVIDVRGLKTGEGILSENSGIRKQTGVRVHRVIGVRTAIVKWQHESIF